MVYAKVIKEFQSFKESRAARQTRVDNAWDALTRGKRTAHQFLPLFRATIADFEKEGVGKSEQDYYMGYIRKVGQPWRGEIFRHLNMYPTGDGGKEFRSPQTWREAHDAFVFLQGTSDDSSTSSQRRRETMTASSSPNRSARRGAGIRKRRSPAPVEP